MATREPGRRALAGELPPATGAPPNLAAARAARRARSGSPSPEGLPDLYRALADADGQCDLEALARVGWQLFSATCAAQQANSEVTRVLCELRGAARAVVAGEGSPGALALLRDVLARHRWLPPLGATPLQMLAAPEDLGPAFR